MLKITEEELNKIVSIAKDNGITVHKLHGENNNKFCFITEFVPAKKDSPFHGLVFTLYEYRFYDLCKKLNLI